MEGLDNLILFMFVVFITIMVASIIPAIVGLVPSNAEHDETFRSYFSRADDALYFTDKKTIHMRNNYTNEYRCRFRNTMYFIALGLISASKGRLDATKP